MNNNELQVIPRAVEYNLYRIHCVKYNDIFHTELEIETSATHRVGEKIYFRNEEFEGYCSVELVGHELYKHRLSETHMRWVSKRLYTLKEIICQEVKEKESMVEG